MNKKTNIVKPILLINFAAGALFSLLCLNFSFDISILAFLLSAGFSAAVGYFTFIKVLRDENGKFILPLRKLSEYYPFVLFISFILRRAGKNGTPLWYDIITVLLWVVVFVVSFIVSNKLNDKHVLEFAGNFKIKPEVNKKYKGMQKVIFETASWVDALVWAIFNVMILQIFLFQLYEIPSESMVPYYLVKDKVIVSKLECGPKFPLTNIGLPDLRTYKRGDSIVLRNPHYTIDRKSEVKSVTSQLIYMLTLMQVQLNKDENGEQKADPLVKRITGLPGEQLVMQDGTLYARTKNHDFEPVEADNKYASWNLNTVNPKIYRKIQHIPLSQNEYDEMLEFEEYRRLYDLKAAQFQAQELVRKFEKLAYTEDLSGKFAMRNLFEYTLFSELQDITRKLMCQEGGVEWFNSFMTSWIPYADEKRDLYAESNFRLNVMTKITFGNLVVRYAELIRNNISASLWSSDVTLKDNMIMAEKENWYIQTLLDGRNMPVFPACDGDGTPKYIPDNCYFMMGDNRFNSLDLRHSMEQELAPLSEYDPISVEYYSMMAPQYIHKRYIIGKPFYRFLPAGRVGKVK